MSVAAKIPVVIGPRLAFVVVVLDLTWVVLEWYHPWLWGAAQALVPWLSATGVAGGFGLLSALALTVVPCRLSWRDLGLSPPQILAAVLTAASIWALNQVAQIVDVVVSGRAEPRSIDLPGALLSAYSEEVVFRMILIGGAARLLSGKVGARHPVLTAVAISAGVFALAHIPHDLALGYFERPARYFALLAFAGLMSAVYLLTRNLLTAALIHVLVNEPVLMVAGRHVDEVTVCVTWVAAALLAAGYARRRARKTSRSGEPGGSSTGVAEVPADLG